MDRPGPAPAAPQPADPREHRADAEGAAGDDDGSHESVALEAIPEEAEGAGSTPSAGEGVDGAFPSRSQSDDGPAGDGSASADEAGSRGAAAGASAEGEEEEDVSEEEEDDDAADVEQLRLLFHGITVRKHGRRGWPKERIVWVDARHTEIVLRWGPVAARAQNHPELEPTAEIEDTPDRVMRFGEVQSVHHGAHGPVLGGKTSDLRAPRWVCLMGIRRSLDIEFPTEESAKALAKAMTRFVEDRELFSQAIMYLFNNGLLPPAEYPQQHAA